MKVGCVIIIYRGAPSSNPAGDPAAQHRPRAMAALVPGARAQRQLETPGDCRLPWGDITVTNDVEPAWVRFSGCSTLNILLYTTPPSRGMQRGRVVS